MTEHDRPVIGCDFDGVLHIDVPGAPFNPVPVYDPDPHALEMVENLIDMGYEVVIHTTRARNPEYIENVKRWLSTHGFPDMEVTDRKVKAKMYVDDRARRYDGDPVTVRTILSHAREIIDGKRDK